jgi:integrase
MAVGKLTKQAVDAAGPGFLWDAEVSGFGLKVTSSRRVYILQYRPGGRGTPTKRVTIGTLGAPWTPAQARREAKRILGEVAAGRDPAAERRAKREAAKAAAGTTVAAVVELWLARDQAKRRTVREVRRIMNKKVLPVWGERPVAAIRKADVIELVERVADRAPIAANRTLAYIKRLLTWAAGRDLVESNVAQFVERPGEERDRDRVLTDAELAAVWRAAGEMGAFGAGIRLLVCTGCRRSEIFEARWPEITLDGAEPAIRLPRERAKTDAGRVIALNRLAVEILRSLPRFAGSDWVLTIRGKAPVQNFSQAKAELDRLADVSGWVLHDLRRCVASGLQKLGTRLEVIEAVLGHVSGTRAGVVGVYQRHRFEAEARAALAAWGEHLDAILRR